jgi:hypothetical protein
MVGRGRVGPVVAFPPGGKMVKDPWLRLMKQVRSAPDEDTRMQYVQNIADAILAGSLEVPDAKERPGVGIFLRQMAEKYGIALPSGAGGPQSEIGGLLARRRLFSGLGGQKR